MRLTSCGIGIEDRIWPASLQCGLPRFRSAANHGTACNGQMRRRQISKEATMKAAIYRLQTLIGLLLLMCAGLSHAQTSVTGAIAGSVKDSSGAVLTDATVEATNTDTQVTDQSHHQHVGLYRFPSLLPGTYSITVTKAGFEKFIQGGSHGRGRNSGPPGYCADDRCGNLHGDRHRAGTSSSDRLRRSQRRRLTANQINNLPTFGNNITRLTLLAPACPCLRSTRPSSGKFRRRL